ncbi:hypothetical protein Poly24_07510 [Rosistilla carotiformis]|uniref:BioF2-like acetyltransferase domain-containing protein n=2 Tax=Rosistilla carotiformis TaxID=2528017 RepID=A0A518JNC4_9BACT|nr:hypothetical protein Poly24_07510 [Rosistilla carotiformis]
MAADTCCWPVIFYDGDRPVAISCITRYRADAGILTEGIVQKLIGTVREFLPSFLHLKIVFAGLPISAGQRGLLILQDTDHEAVVQMMDCALQDIAGRESAALIVLKEFENSDSSWTDQFSRELRYHKADSLPMNRLEPAFESFDAYLAARSARSRSSIRQSLRKLREAGCHVVQIPGGPEAIERFTDEAHRLYLEVREKSPAKLETAPVAFFHELSRQMGDSAHFTFIYQAERIVGVSCSLKYGNSYQLLFCGIDYAINDQAHLYFNVMFADMDYGLRQNVARINFGQTSDSFKVRLGCKQVPLNIYVKGRRIFRPLLWLIRPFVLPPIALLPPIETFSKKRPNASKQTPRDQPRSGNKLSPREQNSPRDQRPRDQKSHQSKDLSFNNCPSDHP